MAATSSTSVACPLRSAKRVDLLWHPSSHHAPSRNAGAAPQLGTGRASCYSCARFTAPKPRGSRGGGGLCCQALSSDSFPAPKQPKGSPAQRNGGSSGGDGVFLLMLVNVLIFAVDHGLHLPAVKGLYLNHLHPQLHQFLTHMFCHANLQHLSSNLFHLCVFGKLVEETEGGLGVWFVYLLTGLGAAVATFLLSPKVHSGHATVSVGASGAIFGLFAVAVLSRLRWDVKRLLEAAVLGWFVVRQVLDEVRHQVTGGLVVQGLAVSHLAHLTGALAGVLLVMALHRLPPAGPEGAS